ncbi:MAG: hypothetical protein H6739_01730 [Alphaproteobacteria bacterium]|nr:hypothetical protein [Alphaproteobacteria bacterium]
MLLTLALLAAPAHAKSWCATPLVVHEWGVQVFDARGQAQAGVPLPPWFYTLPPNPTEVAEPVRGLPPDNGERALPVLQFYAGRSYGSPVAVEVGFTQGQASAWYPQVDRYTPARVANGPEAAERRAALLTARAEQGDLQSIFERSQGENPLLPPDPTRQLAWDALALTPESDHGQPLPTDVPWVQQLREVEGALWVQQGEAMERFLFYEAETSESPAVRIERIEDGREGHVKVVNTSDWPIYDVFVVTNKNEQRSVFYAPAIPAGRSAGFLLSEHTLDDPAAWLRTRLLERDDPLSRYSSMMGDGECVMGRDPAVPVERAEGHGLYDAEIDVLLDVWGERFFEQPGTTVVYRESTVSLDALMPLSIYTDMTRFVVLNRTGLVLWEGLDLDPAP